MSNHTDIETVIIGSGQAGLATGYHLKRSGRPFLIVDANARVGDNWRQQWDSLRLYTPAKYDGLPGMRFPAPKWSFPGKADVADFIEAYAVANDIPVRLRTRVKRLERREGRFEVTVDTDGVTDVLTADNVVVATGTFGRTAMVPNCAADLDPSILQMHSSEYRRPDQLQDGPVLAVGASHSGTDVAYEVALTHPTILCGRDCGQFPFRIEGRGARIGFPIFVFLARHVLTRRNPFLKRILEEELRTHGGPMLRVRRDDLAERGVQRIDARVAGAVDGRPQLDDGQVLEVSNVVWCTGFKQVFDWIDLPVLRDDGWPAEYRGVVDGMPGLYFCGLAFQYAFSSMVLPGVGRDAAYVARHIAARRGAARLEPVA